MGFFASVTAICWVIIGHSAVVAEDLGAKFLDFDPAAGF